MREYWWGTYNPSTGVHDPTPRFVEEIAVLKETFAKDVFHHVRVNTNWDKDFWYIVDDIQKGIENGENFYLILTIRFANKKKRSGEPKWEKTVFQIKILYSSSYPHVAPDAFILYPFHSKTLNVMQHVLSDGALCLYNARDGHSYGWDPSENTGATIALWAIQWLRAYRYYTIWGRWPGKAH